MDPLAVREDAPPTTRITDSAHGRAVADDRDRIARDPHDHVIQRLFGTGLALEAFAAAHPEHRETIDRQVAGVDAAIKAIRTTIFQLHDPQTGAAPGLRRRVLDVMGGVAPRMARPPLVVFTGQVDLALTGELADDVVAVVRETLSNVIRHAEARQTLVEVAVTDVDLRVSVDDDGRGVPAEAGASSGVAGVVVALLGSLRRLPAVGRGTEHPADEDRREGRGVVHAQRPGGASVHRELPPGQEAGVAHEEPAHDLGRDLPARIADAERGALDQRRLGGARGLERLTRGPGLTHDRAPAEPSHSRSAPAEGPGGAGGTGGARGIATMPPSSGSHATWQSGQEKPRRPSTTVGDSACAQAGQTVGEASAAVSVSRVVWRCTRPAHSPAPTTGSAEGPAPPRAAGGSQPPSARSTAAPIGPRCTSP